MVFFRSVVKLFILFLQDEGRNVLATFYPLPTVWPDWAIYWTYGKFLKPLATINLPKSPTFLGIFVKVSKCIIFIVKSFLANF